MVEREFEEEESEKRSNCPEVFVSGKVDSAECLPCAGQYSL